MTIQCPYSDCAQDIAVAPSSAGTQAFCPTCGRPFTCPRLDQFPKAAGPSGVGGCLAFFCLAIAIFTPLIGFPAMIRGCAQIRSAPLYRDLEHVIIWLGFGTTVLIVYGIRVGNKIWNGDKCGRELAKRYLIVRLYSLLGIIGIALIMIQMTDFNIGIPELEPEYQKLKAKISGLLLSASVTPICMEVVFYSVWWSYFSRSRRVRNTYG